MYFLFLKTHLGFRLVALGSDFEGRIGSDKGERLWSDSNAQA
jgi:hypothetical protein